MATVKEKIYQIALSHVRGLGHSLLKKLIAHFGSAQDVYNSSLRELVKIPGVRKCTAQAILRKDTLSHAEALLTSHQRAGVKIVTLWEDTYPDRLRHAYNAPPLLYMKGNADLNDLRIVSIVGTREATPYGKKVIEKLLAELSGYPLLIVSGLAYGIDIHAHKIALQYGLSTLAVLANGLDIVYPSAHKNVVEAMLKQGGLLSEHPIKTKPEAFQFAARNRIIAGLSDVVVVVEAGQKSGALITANYANEYDREVFAVAGNIYEPRSMGCHQLIKTHRAHLLTDVSDILQVMNWDARVSTHNAPKPTDIQVVLAETLARLTNTERLIVQALMELQKEAHIDELSQQAQVSSSFIAAALLQLELKKVISYTPGRKIALAAY